jgi:parvulin-like peptidyl-prolyl isomerase
MINLKRLFFVLLIFNFNYLFSQESNADSKEILTTKDSISFYLNIVRPISKSITFSKCKSMRVSYIYFDGSKSSRAEIETLRKKIISDYNRGISFASLANKYTMDNAKDGDLGWFDEGQMEKSFQDEILKHKKGAIFTVDIPVNNWFYVVLKTFDDIEKTKITYILKEN